MKDYEAKYLAKVGILATIAFLLQFIGSILKIKIQFLEIEISDFPAIIGALALGPLAGVAIEFIKNVFHGIAMTSTGWVGEFANFVVNGTFVFVIGIIYKHFKTKKGAVIALLCGTIGMCVVGFFANVYVMLPFYAKIFHLDFLNELSARISMALTLITPFNFVKGIVLSILTMFTYKRLSPILHK